MSVTAAKPLTKTEVINALSDSTDLSKQQVNDLLEELGKLIGKNLEEGAAGVFTLPGLMKIKVVRKEAKPERVGMIAGEERVFKAQPAKNVVKISPLKKLKEMV